MIPDLAVVDGHPPLGCGGDEELGREALRRLRWRRPVGEGHEGVGVDREPGFLFGFANRGGATGGGEISSGEISVAGKSAGSMRPPGNTHIPPANASRESRRSMSVSSPDGASRSRTTVAAATIGAGSEPSGARAQRANRSASFISAPGPSGRADNHSSGETLRYVHGRERFCVPLRSRRSGLGGSFISRTLTRCEVSRDSHAPLRMRGVVRRVGSRAMTEAAVVAVRGLTKSYGSVQAVADLDFEVEPGQVCGLLGPERRGQDDRAAHAGRIDPADRG